MTYEATKGVVTNYKTTPNVPLRMKVPEKVFLSKHADVCRRLKEGHSMRNTAKITGNGLSTGQRVKEVLLTKGTHRSPFY